jgi:putative toxin-antitoxin system antitoxin component (TIGR02293 family)
MTKVGHMKKIAKNIKPKNYRQNTKVAMAEEPMPIYNSVKAIPSLKDFTFSEFKKIADKAPFTQAEWASILHLSERTLQRYAKSNGTFAPMNAERALQIATVLEQGKITFGKVENFYSWLKRNPYMLEGNLSFESLTSAEGIQMVLTQLQRIQHGIFA